MNQKLRIKYDHSLKVMTVSPSAWTATGPTQWLPNYRIISTIENPLADRLGVINISHYYHKDDKARWTTKEIVESKEYEAFLADNDLDDYMHLVNRATKLDFKNRALKNDYKVVNNFENKVWLRESFGSKLRFPPFSIVTYGSLVSEATQDAYERLTANLDTNDLIIQHQSLSGGRGTHSVSNAIELEQCLQVLSSEFQDATRDERLVVSKRLPAIKERTLQMCITADAILVGPPQAQLIGHPMLVSNRPKDIQFCGGRIAPGLLSEAQYQTASESARIVGEALKSEGYRGIFGVDYIVSDDEIYPIEVNPRMTGMSTLLAFLQVELPFLLLHILELGQVPYELADVTGADEDISGSFVVVQALSEGVSTMQTGVYDSEAKFISQGWENGSILPSDENAFFVAMRITPGQRVEQGKSLAFIYSRGQLFDDTDKLNEQVHDIVKRIQTLS
jgi:hypothetical protein